MIPNSFQYFGFLLLGAGIYRVLPNMARRAYLLILSILFYWIGAAEYLWLLAVTVLAGYGVGRWLEHTKRKKPVLILGLVLCFGTLAGFKYLRFLGQLGSLPLAWLGLPALVLPAPLLPLGISFYLFVTSGYLIDVYRGKRAAERNLLDYALFVSFFPAILSGPIERADHLLPQLKALPKVSGDDVRLGVTRLLSGLARKVLIADSLAILVNTAYSAPDSFSGLQLMVAAIAYSFQIFFDFSACSEMAVGAARLFGIRLCENFHAPYLADSCKEFWRRWHISLSTWFRDYVYIPLGGSRRGKVRTWLNVMIVFALSGLWHGAAMNFVVWGLLCGAYQVVGAMTLPARKRLPLPWDAGWRKALRILVTFALTTVSWVFFRADSCTQALFILKRIVTAGGACFPLILTELGMSAAKLWVLGVSLVLFFTLDCLEEIVGLRDRVVRTVWLRCFLWAALLAAVALFGAYGSGYDAQEFVYFRF